MIPERWIKCLLTVSTKLGFHKHHPSRQFSQFDSLVLGGIFNRQWVDHTFSLFSQIQVYNIKFLTILYS